MLLHLLRLSSTEESTLGALYMNGAFACWTLEDPWRAEKVAGVTRIHPGLYQLKLRVEGNMHLDYLKRYGEMHRGMLWLQDTAEFSYVYLHTGNAVRHSAGCVLVGDNVTEAATEAGQKIGASRRAYRRIYPPVAAAIKSGEGASIRISDVF